MNGIEITPEHPVDRLVGLGERAERAGFDTAFVSSHYFNRDSFLVLDRIAAATDEIHLGPGVVNPYESHPAVLASQMATLDEVSDGRAVFGIGAGDRSALRALGVERDRPLRRVLESFSVMRDLWAGERVSHDGTFVARDAELKYPAGDIPVYVGAQGPHMLRMSAKHADGVLVNASHPDDVAWASEQIERGLADRPEERGAFEAVAYASVSIARTDDAAREAARPPVAFIASDVAPAVLDRHGIERERAAEIGAALERGEFRKAFGLVTPAMLDAFCVAGTPETVEARIERLLAHVDGIVAAAPLGPDLESAVDLAATAIDRATDAQDAEDQ